jgi:DNA-3-methyladenine glycosylase I
MDDGLIEGPDGRPRCWWPGDKEDYLAYHDEEWGRPVDRRSPRLFEKLVPRGLPERAQPG